MEPRICESIGLLQAFGNRPTRTNVGTKAANSGPFGTVFATYDRSAMFAQTPFVIVASAVPICFELIGRGLLAATDRIVLLRAGVGLTPTHQGGGRHG
jgi:hypothetical protein